jgi:hypothetical protein
MSVNRLMVVVPLMAGLVVTGSAVARMMPAQSVRDSVYQTCAHNGVHFNKQGHANCGLHKGWSQGEPGSTTTSDQPTGTAGTSGSDSSTAGSGGHATHVHPSKPVHVAKTHGAKTHSAKTHGAKAHGGGKSSHNKHG